MSVALSLSDKHNHRKPSSRIWLNDIDPDGRRVDPRFIEAGYRKESAFFRYRHDELQDEAVAANLIEEAVYRASRARKREPLDDVDAYLFTVFANLVDREISRSPRTLNFEPQALQNLSNSGPETTRRIITRIEIEELLGTVDGTTREAIEMRSLGYEVQEIARLFNISADCLSTRIRRALKTLKTFAQQRSQMSDNSVAHE